MRPRKNPTPQAPGRSGSKHEHGAATAAPAWHASDRDLTPSRREILTVLRVEGRPLGAYDIIDRLADAGGKRRAPISIYRALDFLLENGLVHRLASRNAYLACGHNHDAQELVVFLICEKCGAVNEATSQAMRRSLASLVSEAGFAPRAQVVEVAGRCSQCQPAS